MSYFAVPFVSQHWHKKSADIGCGVASAMMLLKHALPKTEVPDYDDLCESLHIWEDPKYRDYDEECWGILGAYPHDVQQYFETDLGMDVFFQEEPATDSKFRSLVEALEAHPIMVGVEKNKYGHWWVLTGVDSNRCFYLDPNDPEEKKRSISISRLRKIWDGHSVGIAG